MLSLSGLSEGHAQPASDRLTIPQIKMKSSDAVQVFVSGVDERGTPIKGLGTANFTVKVDDRQINDFTVQPVEETGRGISVVLALDVSRSMQGEKIEAARKAAAQFIKNLGPQDQGCLLVFGQSVRWLVEEFTPDKAALKAPLANLVAQDMATLLNEAFFKAAQKGATAPTSQVAVVVLTDGRDQTSSISLDQAIREAQHRNVPIYTLGFGSNVDSGSLNQIAMLTGGRFFTASHVQSLTGFYLMLLEQLSSQHVLEIQAPNWALGEHKMGIDLRYRGSLISQQRAFQIQTLTPGPVTQQRQAPTTRPAWWMLIGIALGLLVIIGGFSLVRKKARWFSKKPPSAADERKCAYCGTLLSDGDTLYCANCEGRAPVPSDEPIEEIVEPAGPAPARPASDDSKTVWLEILTGEKKGQRVYLSSLQDPLTIGRGSDNGLVIDDGDRHVSRHHVNIAANLHGRFVLKDSSAGGTYVNSRKISIPEALQDGDKIGLGSAEAKLIFRDQRGS
jgi:VWFA-related protein